MGGGGVFKMRADVCMGGGEGSRPYGRTAPGLTLEFAHVVQVMMMSDKFRRLQVKWGPNHLI